MILAYAAYLLRWAVVWRAWAWLIAVAILAATAGLVLRRSSWARYPVYGVVAIYVALWLFPTAAAVINMWRAQSWLVDVLMFVPGLVLVVAPAVYSVHVARIYIRRR